MGLLPDATPRLLLLDLTKLHENIEGLRLGIQGTVRLGSIVAAITELVPEAIAVISREQPTLSISLVTDNSDALLAMLENGRLDVMIGRLTGLQHSDNLRLEPLAGEDLRLIVRTGHPLAARPDVTLPELASERWVLQPEASAMRRTIAGCFHTPAAAAAAASRGNFLDAGNRQHSRSHRADRCGAVKRRRLFRRSRGDPRTADQVSLLRALRGDYDARAPRKSGIDLYARDIAARSAKKRISIHSSWTSNPQEAITNHDRSLPYWYLSHPKGYGSFRLRSGGLNNPLAKRSPAAAAIVEGGVHDCLNQSAGAVSSSFPLRRAFEVTAARCLQKA